MGCILSDVDRGRLVDVVLVASGLLSGWNVVVIHEVVFLDVAFMAWNYGFVFF